MGDSRDIAYNPKLVEYETGRQRHQERLVIRIRKGDSRTDTKSASSTKDVIDSSGAGKEWDIKELDVSNVYRGEVVVVVGEYSSSFLELDGIAKASVVKKMQPTKKRKKKIYQEQESKVRATTNDAYIVVRKVVNRQSNLYRLANKKNGLCEILSLDGDTSDRVFFYHEWVTDTESPQHATRRLNWCSNLNVFCERYMKEHSDDFLDMPRVLKPAKRQKKESPGTTGPSQSIASSLQNSVTSFQATGSKFYLEQLIARAEAVFGSGRMPKSEDMTYQQAVIQTFVMAVDEPDLETATEAASACKKLWPPLEGVEAAPISAHILMRLSDGLRENALSGVAIEESLYRAFITNFCLLHAGKLQADDKQRDGDINMAYRIARLTVGAKHDTTPSVCIDLTKSE